MAAKRVPELGGAIVAPPETRFTAAPQSVSPSENRHHATRGLPIQPFAQGLTGQITRGPFETGLISVLIDLGAFGQVAGDWLGAGELIGSPAWMAPEQIRGELPHPVADIWPLPEPRADPLRCPTFDGQRRGRPATSRDRRRPRSRLC